MFKSINLKKYRLIGLVISSVILIFIGFYSLNINFVGTIDVVDIDAENVKIHVVTPLNRSKTIRNLSYDGYFSDIKIESPNTPQCVTQTFLGNKTPLEFNKIADHLYQINPPKLSYFQKLSGFFVISKHVIFQLILTVLIFILFSFLSIYFVKLVFKKRKEIKEKMIAFYKAILQFIRIQNYKILMPAFIAILPGGVYALSDPYLFDFLNLSFIQILFASLIVFYTPIFFIFFRKIFNSNLYFWISFLLVFISFYFLFFSNFYIYGQYFRDDISKFFVKAYQNNFINQFFTPDANYLNLFQNLISFVVLKVFRFKYYFPEVLQLIVLVTIVLIYSSFNLKIFREIMKNDFNRFLISVLSPFLFVLLTETIALYHIPFIAALIFLPVLFLDFEKLAPIIQVSIIFIFSIFILSKPIFIVYLLFIVLKVIHAFYRKNWKTFFGFGILLVAIFIQFGVSYSFYDMPFVAADGPLGTRYDNSYRQDHVSIIANFIYGLFIYIRVHIKLFFPYFTTITNANIFINIFTFLSMVFLNAWLLFRFIKNRTKTELLILSGNIIAFLSCLLFVKTVNIEELEENSLFILNYNFIEMLQSGYLPSSHRYLILVFAPVITSLGFFFFNRPKNKHVFTGSLSVGIVFLVIFYTVSVLPNLTYKMTKPKQSIWRQNADLIFNYRNEFYIPFYEYPIETECVNYGIDRITDVVVPENGIIHIDSLGFQTNNWQVIQLVTEFDSIMAPKIYAVKCETKNNEVFFYKSFNPINSSFRFIIFRFDKYINPKTITFVNKELKPIKLVKPIRLIGKY